MSVLPGAEPLRHDGSADVGVLLCHGFTGTPQSMRPWAERLAAEGFTVRLPRLPGHGTRWEDMARTGWPDWFGALEAELMPLAKQCTTTVVCGLSMGGTLALRLAQTVPDAVSGLVLVNPSVLSLRTDMKLVARLGRLLAPVLRCAPGIAGDVAQPDAPEVGYDRVPIRAAHSLTKLWALVRRDLGSVRAPLLLLHSRIDHVVEPINAQVVADGVASTDLTDVVLENSYHVATLDYDAEKIFEASIEFTRRLHTARTGNPTS